MTLAGLLLLLPAAAFAGNNPPVTGAAFTTTNIAADGADFCENGPNNGQDTINCNLYQDKQYVWLNGGPSVAYVGDGDYFFAVLSPGGQASPNDGASNQANGELANLSDNFDTYLNRRFNVTDGTVTYSPDSDPATANHDVANNKIRLMPYADTPNLGGVYILAICSLDKGYPVNPARCKYDAFKVKTATPPGPQPLLVTKTAEGIYDTSYSWTIKKDTDRTEVKQAGTDATLIYTIVATKDGGTAVNYRVEGEILVTNPNNSDVTGVTVTDTLPDASCTVTGGSNATIIPGTTTFDYTCTYTGTPADMTPTNTATASWGEQTVDGGTLAAGSATGTAGVTFGESDTPIGNCVTVVDDNATPLDASDDVTLGTTCATKTYTHSISVKGVAGTCKEFTNTASLTAGATGSDDATVKLCVGADLTVEKTASPSFTRTYTWKIEKSVDRTLVKQVGGSATFNYTVKASQTGFTDSGWKVTGSITVANPNDWQAVAVNSVTDALPGASCSIDGGFSAFTLAKQGEVGAAKTLAYTCTFAAQPAYNTSLTNTATAFWDKDAVTPNGSASGTASATFSAPTTTVNKTVTVTDSFNGGAATTLGSLTATDATPYTSATFTYPRTIAIPQYGCLDYNNTATIVQTGQTASAKVTVCGPINTGARTMGFWQGPNGQNVITTSGPSSGTCAITSSLRTYTIFSDLSATASCSQVAAYVNNTIKSANAGNATMTAMLKGQMLATALDVYFTGPGWTSGNAGRFLPNSKLGDILIDLTRICKVGNTSVCNNASTLFGATSLKVSDILTRVSANYTGWSRSQQELAKDVFDAINNQIVFAP
jgi:hypothetical protein